MSNTLLLGIGGVIGLNTISNQLTAYHVPEPYMDEIFHVDQIQQYCAGNWSYWNAKLSTPPGLYLFTVPFTLLFSVIPMMDDDAVCSLVALRCYNVFWMVVLLTLVTRARGNEHIVSKQSLATLEGIVCVLMPVLYFSTVLYYTDLISLICVLFTYYLQQRGCLKLSAVLGICGLLCRQPNIVWLVLCAALAVVLHLQAQFAVLIKRNDQLKFANDGTIADMVNIVLQLPITTFVSITLRAVQHIWPFVFAFSAAVLAFVLNGYSMSMGDHTAHVPVPHLPQMLYCIAFISGFGWPVLLQYHVIRRTWHDMTKYWYLTVVLVALALIAVHYFTYEHEYLMADNRHYTFYLWRKVFKRHIAVKYAFSVACVPLMFAFNVTLEHRTQIWRLGVFIAVFLVVVPNRLLEFRYFIMPYFMWRLHVPGRLTTTRVIVCELITFVVINAITLYAFLYMPFTWKHEPGAQRFMW